MAHSRAYDPSTSHAAADSVEKNGTAQSNRDLCLAYVLRHPEGVTCGEIGKATGLVYPEPWRRLPELRDAGLVKDGPKRSCRVKGSKMQTWLPIETPRVQRELFG
jgi:hypothetical protein